MFIIADILQVNWMKINCTCKKIQHGKGYIFFFKTSMEVSQFQLFSLRLTGDLSSADNWSQIRPHKILGMILIQTA